MKITNFIFFFIGIFLLLSGWVLGGNYTLFENKEEMGYFSHFLIVSAILVVFLQFTIWIIRLLIAIVKELWNEYKSRI
ncbi:MAG: hypothetical protein RBQ81_09005 [Arcobacteraceae bacterium]|jgi:hypothetical protein|nr:hypothetical protein [Arcobacteraceae bacterium]